MNPPANGLASRSPIMAAKCTADKSSTAIYGKAPLRQVASGSSSSSGAPPMPLSPHPQRHHFLPAVSERAKCAKISDARLVGWRKSMTKLSAQEALESDAAAAAASPSTVPDDYSEYYSSHSVASSMALSPHPPVIPIASTSSSFSTTSASSPTSTTNYRTIVRSRRDNSSSQNSQGTALIHGSDLEDDQGFHDEEEDDDDGADEVSVVDEQACLSGKQKSNCHYFYHRGGANQQQQQPAAVSSQQQSRDKYGRVPAVGPLRSGLQTASVSSRPHGSQSTYYYYRAPPPVPSPPYSDPYRAEYESFIRQATANVAPPPLPPVSSVSFATRLLPAHPQPAIVPVPPSQRPRSKLQSFFSNFSRPTSTNGTNGKNGGTGLFSGAQTNLTTTTRSSSFFFLASNNYKKNAQEKKGRGSKETANLVGGKSSSTSSSTNTTSSSSSSSASSTSSCMSNALFKGNPSNGVYVPQHHPAAPASGFGSALYRSEIFQMMSNSVTELRNRKSLLKKLTLSSSSSSRSSSRRSSANSVSERSKLKAKKLKELYYLDEDDYEEIDDKRGSGRCLFSCCLPFGRR